MENGSKRSKLIWVPSLASMPKTPFLSPLEVQLKLDITTIRKSFTASEYSSDLKSSISLWSYSFRYGTSRADPFLKLYDIRFVDNPQMQPISTPSLPQYVFFTGSYCPGGILMTSHFGDMWALNMNNPHQSRSIATHSTYSAISQAAISSTQQVFATVDVNRKFFACSFKLLVDHFRKRFLICYVLWKSEIVWLCQLLFYSLSSIWRLCSGVLGPKSSVSLFFAKYLKYKNKISNFLEIYS